MDIAHAVEMSKDLTYAASMQELALSGPLSVRFPAFHSEFFGSAYSPVGLMILPLEICLVCCKLLVESFLFVCLF